MAEIFMQKDVKQSLFAILPTFRPLSALKSQVILSSILFNKVLDLYKQ